MKRTRLAPPPHLKHLPTKLVGGTVDRDILLRQGWTIVEANGQAIVDEPHNGANIDVPPNISERIGETITLKLSGGGSPELVNDGKHPKERKKRPRIGEQR